MKGSRFWPVSLAVAMTAGVLVPAAAARSYAPAWVRHRNPLGFEVTHPNGWLIDLSIKDVIVIRSDDQAAWIVVHPFINRQRLSAQQWLNQAPALLPGLLAQGRVARSHQRSRNPDEALASVAFLMGGAPAQASLMCVSFGRVGMFYGIAATSAQFPARRQQLVQILQTFKFTQPAARGGGGPQLAFVPWQDPREGAFTIQVPAQWRVDGGLFRHGTVDIRGAVQMSSPDGQALVIAGDSSVPPHTVPSQMLTMTGFREGSWYSPGYNTRFLVRRFLTGTQFASEYVQGRFASSCPGFRITQARDLPQSSQELSGLYRSFPGLVTMQVHAGEVAFTCTMGGQPAEGYLFSGTLLISGQGYALWQVPFLHGYLATQPQVGAAHAALRQMLQSIQINPQWLQRQQAATAQTSAIISDTHRHITRIIDDTYNNRQRSWDEYSRKRSNVILGQTDVVDPETGERWKVSSGSNYYWRQDYTDNIVGTNTYTRSDINFSPLLEY